MEEHLISFEIAKLAKQKGFKEKTFKQYEEDGYLNRISKSIDVVIGNYEELLFAEFYSAPLQSVLQQWLRDTHKIHIHIFPEDDDKNITWSSKLFILNFGEDNEVHYKRSVGRFNTYELALEASLYESLKLI